jgi:hypothetical protein
MHACWHAQALRSLTLTRPDQEFTEDAATLTQLTRLEMKCEQCIYHVSCLSALTGLQSLSLSRMSFEGPGLSVVAQGCSRLTQLKLTGIDLKCEATDRPPCSWPALREMQLVDMWPWGVLDHVLPAPQAAPQLAQFVCKDVSAGRQPPPKSWPADLQHVGFYVPECEDEDAVQLAAQLAADLRAVAACLPIAAISINIDDYTMLQLAAPAALAPVAGTVTHLHVDNDEDVTDPPILHMCRALPHLHSLSLSLSLAFTIPDIARLLQHRPPLRSLVISNQRAEGGGIVGVPSDRWVERLLRACAYEQACADRPPLTVQLPHLEAAALATAAQLWAQLSAQVARVTPVVVTDTNGNKLA